MKAETEIKEHAATAEKLRISKEFNDTLEEQLNKTKDMLENNEKNLKLQLKMEQDSHSIQCEELKLQNTNQYNEIEKIKETVTYLQSENLTLHEMVKKQQISMQELQEKLCISNDQRTILLEFPDLNGPINRNRVKGNPFQDMEGQLQANTLRIHLLEEQNKKLQKSSKK